MKNHFDTNNYHFETHNLNYISSICLGVIFLCLNLYKKNYKILLTFLIVSILFFIFNRGKHIKLQIIDTILISVIITLIIYNFSKLYSKQFNEGFDNGESKTESKTEESKTEELVDSKTTEEKDDEEEPYVDLGSTFLNAYRKLDTNQIKGMTNDTKQLIETQKNLMDTMKSLTPIISEGKKVLDTFTNYFDT